MQNGEQSGAKSTAISTAEPSELATVSDSCAFKQQGNNLIKENKPKSAVKAYASALKAAAVEHVDDQEKAVLLSNRSYAYVRCSLFIKVRNTLCIVKQRVMTLVVCVICILLFVVPLSCA